ncbi:MAG: signal peptidase II [Myxococcota bacterium]|nr:signal peptidase II [Myxococcota bacterium]
MNELLSGKLRALLAGGCLALGGDQLAKAWVSSSAAGPRRVIFSLFDHELALVPRRDLSLGLSGLGEGGASPQAFGLVLATALIATVALLFYRGLARGERLNGFALGLVLGGGLGNLLEGLWSGSVTGMLHWVGATQAEGSYFNPADVFLVSGVLILLVELLVVEGAARALPDSPESHDAD